jgi:hypothetical protein
MSAANSNPYDLWQRSKLLGVMRQVVSETWQFGEYFPGTILATEEYIDFEKIPVRGRKLAPYVLPAGRGHGVYADSQIAYRFKPANVVVEEPIDDAKGLTFEPGIDQSMLHQDLNLDDPMVRRSLLKSQMTAEAVLSIQRRWEQQRAEVLRTGKLSITYLTGESFLLDFQRASAHTQVLTSGNRFGDSGVSVMDTIQAILDTMNNAAFGGVPVKIVMGSGVWSVIRKDAELKAAMDAYRPYGAIDLERGLVSGGLDGGKVFKVGTIGVGGAGGQTIELWVNNETYDVAGSRVRYVAVNEMLFLSTPSAIMGYQCFGRIKDKDAGFQAIPIFPKNYETGDRVKTENLSFESAPLMVPINPNATYLLQPIA